MICCPLSGSDDGDRPECFTERVVKANKEHTCTECGKPIPKGDRYEAARGLWGSRWSTFLTCLLCVEIRDHFACGEGFLYGQLWSDLGENFFPEMTAGGPCMDGLTPQAKAKLFEERLEWVFSHDEYLPCDRAVPPGYQEPR